MEKISDLTINVGISIDDETVARCCNLLSIYLTDNPDKTIEVTEYHDVDMVRRSLCIMNKESEER